ncbi:MAG: DUF1707 domain-containing protein [Propionibacteriaceae bacterium]
MTGSLPEPSNVGPIAGGSLRASDADREQVVTVLSTAYAEGRLSRDEHDERLSRAMSARTFDDLIPITHDLVVVSPPPAAPVPAVAAGFQIDTTSQQLEPDRMVAVFGGVNRKGKWRIRKNTQALAVFGGMDLDLRDAIFEDTVVEISGFWCFGGLDIKVPAGMEVREQIAGVFGGSDVSDLGERIPGAPTLVIKGLALFGGVSVKGPKVPKKSRR